MKAIRRSIAAIVLGALALLPLPGCAGGGAGGMGQLMGMALGLGASVGSYYLLQELK
ncbi:MAG: hypothetical protein O2894_00435 [Planctomycetota bacterium]|nr:hypothetical protein [Planctomycetota bacterium]